MFSFVSEYFTTPKTCNYNISRSSKGDIKIITTYYGDNILHSFDGIPSIECIDKSYYAWHKDGKLNSLEIIGDNKKIVLPAEIINEKNGISYEIYYKDGELHNDNEPAYIVKDNGNIICKKYFKHGKLHNDNGPAIIEYKYDCIVKQSFYIDGLLHRHDGPAISVYNDDLKNYYLKERIYYNKGLLHNIGSPAYISYNQDKYTYDEYNYENGKLL